jgi:ferredoxin--NADP+ reductase
MPFAITPTCCNDASCVSVCPVNCIHPTPDEPEFGTTEMLYVDPAACIDCGACADACPVDAVFPIESLRGPDAEFAVANRLWYEEHPTDHAWSEPEFPRSLPGDPAREPLRVAVVGAGPAAGYTVRHLLHATDARITLIDRLPVPGGLLRSGVAPDHPATKQIGEGFSEIYRHPRVRLALNVEVGRDVSVAELAETHSAVVYAFGASADRQLRVPGEQLANSLAATDVVGWYNAHPDRTDLTIDLQTERAVVVGTGNVALDIARVLLADPDELARTDVSDVALAALRTSQVREVVLLGRRDVSTAAFTAGEFAALRAVPGLEIVLDRTGLVDGPPATGPLRDVPVVDIAYDSPPPAGRRLVLRFGSPVEALDGGSDRSDSTAVTAVRTRGDAATTIPAGLVIRSIGYTGRALPGLPFDESAGVVPNELGRVRDPATGATLPGAYVAGWIKRGPSGGIGTNRADAAETVHALLDDAAAGRLPTGRDTAAFHRLLRSRTDVVDQARARAIDAAERRAGEAAGRPRVKFVRVEQMLAVDRPKAVARAAAGAVTDRLTGLLSRPSA